MIKFLRVKQAIKKQKQFIYRKDLKMGKYLKSKMNILTNYFNIISPFTSHLTTMIKINCNARNVPILQFYSLRHTIRKVKAKNFMTSWSKSKIKFYFCMWREGVPYKYWEPLLLLNFIQQKSFQDWSKTRENKSISLFE